PCRSPDRLTRPPINIKEPLMSTTFTNGARPSVYGAVQLGYVFVESPRIQDWKRLAADGIGMALSVDSPTLFAFRTDAHARRLIVNKSAQEDLAIGWQVANESALQTILNRLKARKIDVQEIASEEAAVRGAKRIWRFIGPKRQQFELFTEPVLDATAPKLLTSGFVTGERGLGHVA